MKLNPLHTPERLAHHILMTGEYFPVERCTGRSTAQALSILAVAIQCPHIPVRIVDHHGTTGANGFLRRTMQDMVDKLNLEHMRFSIDNTVTFTR